MNILLPKIDDKCDVLLINGRHGVCRSYYQPDELDIKAVEYAKLLVNHSGKSNLYALDLGCSPYFPQSQRLANLGFTVDAFDLEKPVISLDQINLHKTHINYQVKNIADLTADDLHNNYHIIYSNRCFSFLRYSHAYSLIRILLQRANSKTRFFVGFFTNLSKYAENYPIELPLEDRYVPLNNEIARMNQMFAPVCLYTQKEIVEDLLGDLPITIIEILHAQSGSLKIIFEKE